MVDPKALAPELEPLFGSEGPSAAADDPLNCPLIALKPLPKGSMNVLVATGALGPRL